MSRPLAIALLAFLGCATEPDARPETADYIIEAILVPYCGRGGCHSTNTAARNLIFDTIGGAKAAMLTSEGGRPVVTPMMPDKSLLYTVLVESSKTMPPDVPLPDKDIDLIRRWIEDGAAGLP